MELIVEAILGFLWEVLLQVAGELLLEVGIRSLAEPFAERQRAHP